MTAKSDLTGRRFERLTVLGDVGNRTPKGNILWQCLCDCGKITFVRGDHLKNGKIKSCGCLKTGATKEYMKSITDLESLKSTKPTAKSTTLADAEHARKNAEQEFWNK
ncbi:hypothetical protein [Streptococcus dysgalactiae]|uniref:hypothetical protein n=1 Tax=Streptococcus dysgalactiae TaxID=1334 RepID=UPI0039F616F5